jgi:phosphate transport system substrate-binding protein
MRRRHNGSILLLVMLCSLCLAASDAVAQTVKLKGSGASFPFPLYGRWFKDYGKVNKQVQVDYQAKGSGAGIKDFVNKTVDTDTQGTPGTGLVGRRMLVPML